MSPLTPLAYLSESGVLSSNVAYILNRDRHFLTRELANNGSANTIGLALFNRLCSGVPDFALFALLSRLCSGVPAFGLFALVIWLCSGAFCFGKRPVEGIAQGSRTEI